MNQHKEDAKVALERNKLKKAMFVQLESFVGMEYTQENINKLVAKTKEALK